MMYVLIVALWLTNGVGYVVTMQEFSSKQACDAAAAIIHDMTDDGYSKKYIKTECVPR